MKKIKMLLLFAFIVTASLPTIGMDTEVVFVEMITRDPDNANNLPEARECANAKEEGVFSLALFLKNMFRGSSSKLKTY